MYSKHELLIHKQQHGIIWRRCEFSNEGGSKDRNAEYDGDTDDKDEVCNPVMITCGNNMGSDVWKSGTLLHGFWEDGHLIHLTSWKDKYSLVECEAPASPLTQTGDEGKVSLFAEL
ncbi:hypothetical protein Q5P01_014706 [Channa striata]|uniref:Uncharacterized protein n=1 Tax=Channa striata TaxID=64152 RepID=A0AA88MGT9_CHASR|nr:hypothetical protein Q5P01_014706 [Channa striata]